MKPIVTDDPDHLVREILAGNTDVYAEIVRRFGPDVWREVNRLLRDRDASDNLLQQVFVDAYLHLKSYRPTGNFRAWLLQIARNRLRDELRSYSRQNRRLAHYRELLEQRLNNFEAEEARQQDLLDALAKCRKRLTPNVGRLLRMRYEQALGVETIAAREDCTEDAVRKTLSRARLMLRDCIRTRMETRP